MELEKYLCVFYIHTTDNTDNLNTELNADNIIYNLCQYFSQVSKGPNTVAFYCPHYNHKTHYGSSEPKTFYGPMLI